MRVTANTFPNSLLDQLTRLANRQNNLQTQAATGQRLSAPEDDPTAMRRVLDMQAESSRVLQYNRNVERQLELSSTSFAAIKGLKTLSDKAGETVTSTDSLKSPEELNVYAQQVNAMIRQAIQLANTQNRGEYIFGGTVGDQPPFVYTEDADGLITSVTYQGNTTVPLSEIAKDVTVSAYNPGANTTATGPKGLVTESRTGADFFNHLITFRDHLVGLRSSVLSGDTAGKATQLANVQADGKSLLKDADNFIEHMSANGALQAQLETTKSLGSNRVEALDKLISSESDADLAQTLVRLNEVQTAYQAALQSAGTILNRSLLDYL